MVKPPLLDHASNRHLGMGALVFLFLLRHKLGLLSWCLCCILSNRGIFNYTTNNYRCLFTSLPKEEYLWLKYSDQSDPHIVKTNNNGFSDSSQPPLPPPLQLTPHFWVPSRVPPTCVAMQLTAEQQPAPAPRRKPGRIFPYACCL